MAAWRFPSSGLRLESWDIALAEVGRKLLREWAIALGSDGAVFSEAFGDKPATLIKVIRYPSDGTTSQGVGAHRDSGVLTLLLTEPEVGVCRSRWTEPGSRPRDARVRSS